MSTLAKTENVVDATNKQPGVLTRKKGGTIYSPVERELYKPKKVEFKPMTGKKSEKTDWVWYPYLAAEEITLLAARGGVGKGLIATSLASIISKGGQFPRYCADKPGLTAKLGKVMWFEAEDRVNKTLVPRFMAAGANFDCVSTQHQLDLEDCKLDMAGLRDTIRENDVKLLVLSPLISFLKRDIEANKEKDVRKALEELSAAIEGTGCAVLGITHINKGKGDLQTAIERVIGSVAFTNFVRCVLQIEKEQGEESTYRVVHAKHNLSPRGADLLYTPCHVGTDPKDQFVTVEWSVPVEGNVQDAATIYTAPRTADEDSSAREWLIGFLERNGPTRKDEVKAAWPGKPGTLDNAFSRGKKAGLFDGTVEGFQGHATWALATQTAIGAGGKAYLQHKGALM